MTPMDTATGIELRWLQGDELAQLDPIIQSHGWVPLNPALSRALVAFKDGMPVAFVPLTMIPHIEPIWASEDERGSGLIEEMVDKMVEFLYEVNAPEAYVIARSTHSVRLAERHGMERITNPVFYKRGR